MERQTYATHVHRPASWLLAWAAAVLAFVLLFWVALSERSMVSIALVLLAGVVVWGLLILRQSALRLQDRIIRLEMQVRLARLGLTDAGSRLTLAQLVALRFASDAELPSLLERAVAGTLAPDAIKRAITDWQGDHLRT
jgi:Flp pilus assembly protein TadB